MEHDERILGYIAKDENISQRQLARLTDLSPGHINLLLHKLVNKGLLKIEKVKPSNLKYILTTQGIARNAIRTYSYVRNAIKFTLTLKAELEKIFERYGADDYVIYVDGEKDEIYQIVNQVLIDKKLAHIEWVNNIDELQNRVKKSVVVLWQIEKEETYRQCGIEYINLLNRIDDL